MGNVIRIHSSTQPQAPSADAAPTLHRAALMQCHADACNSGREPCPCPQACEISTDAQAAAVFWRLYAAILLVAVISTVAVVWPA